jgi:hypothetical protein
LLSKPSRQTRSSKKNDPGVKEGICKVIGFASTGVQFAFSCNQDIPRPHVVFGNSQSLNPLDLVKGRLWELKRQKNAVDFGSGLEQRSPKNDLN